jgi:hypothetical protein
MTVGTRKDQEPQAEFWGEPPPGCSEKDEPCNKLLGSFGSQLSHDLINHRLGNVLGQLERTAVGDDLYSLASGIVQHMAAPALGQMEFEFLEYLGRNAILEVIAELGKEFIASNH